jgi:hypothetical protein
MKVPKELPTLYTSRWQNKKLADMGMVPVGISRGTPRFKLPYCHWLLRLLTPTRETLGIEDTEEVLRSYLDYLEELSITYIGNRPAAISHEHGSRPLALLCYEDTHAGETFHRRTFADWWKEQAGQEVLELVPATVAPLADTLTQEKVFGSEVNDA